MQARRALVTPASHERSIRLFVWGNVALFLLMCAFTYYARFVHYRGAGNVWEFFVYAAVIVTGIVASGTALRRFAVTPDLLMLIQFGIAIHFCGAFVSIGDGRLYDVTVAGIRYDKIVHFTNAWICARVVGHLFTRYGLRADGFTRFAVLLAVLGLGAFVEIVEYLVSSTVPATGVGGYDNNMQDLIANLAGASLGAVMWSRWPSTVSREVRRRQVVGVMEVALIVGLGLVAIWTWPSWLLTPAGLVLTRVGVPILLFLVVYFLPVVVHRDTLAERGLGSWRSAFVRTDNLAAAGRAFAVVTAVAGALIVVSAMVWNPTWIERTSLRVWAVRGLFYSGSALIQTLVIQGYVLVRLRDVFGDVAGSERSARQALMIAVTAGLLLGLLHLPDPTLAILATIFFTVSVWLGLRTPNVLAAAGMHAVLGLLVHRMWELPIRIGITVLHPELHPVRAVLPWTRTMIGNLY